MKNTLYLYQKEVLPHPVLEGHQDWIDLYYKAWELAFTNIEYIDLPGWKDILTCMPGVGIIWQWDSCMMTFITNYSNGTLSAFWNLDNLYRLRRPKDGFMAMAYNIEKEEEQYPGRINPPLMAWAEWEHYLITGDSSRFEQVLPALEGIYDFIEKNRRRESCGLYWFEDSGSSGMDNSPRAGYLCEALNGSDVCHIDLACQQALSAKHLAKICDVLGLEAKAAFYAQEQERICALINRYHWSERSRWYFDFFQRSNPDQKVKFINSKTAAAFWTLMCGAAQGERREAVKNHMFDENEFFTKVPFATLSKDDPNYDCTGGYWLGGVWPPTTFAGVRGLCTTGYRELAREAAVKMLTAMCAVDKDPAYGSIWECYAPEAYRPATAEAGELVRSEFVGWGGLPPITMLIENIIGLEFDAQHNTVNFHLHAREKCGLENMLFNGGKISVVCTHYEPFKGRTVIETKAQKPFTLVVKTKYLWDDVVVEVPAGKQVFYI
ncbi:MAG: hypothetical protein IKC46_01470 [Lachnospiraceae bacterium]|nr:hypothetical protein [Lachnospiraceae bacterium]